MQFFTSALLLMAATAQAHYHFPRLIINGQTETADWTTVRQTKNYQSNQGVTDVNSPDMRCYQMHGAASTANIVAGNTVGFVAAASVSHFGPVQFYMAKAPVGQDISTYDAAGNVWFKVGAISAVETGRALTSGDDTWPAYHKTSVSFTMPKAVPNGLYLLRVESIALHQAQAVGGAQIYLSCAQVNITGGGDGKPDQFVAFPGAYKPTDPGLLWSYSTPQMSYTAPGPAVWQG